MTPTQSDFGFICRQCGVRLTVYYTRRREANQVERVRKCPGCGERMCTVEVAVEKKSQESSISGTG